MFGCLAIAEGDPRQAAILYWDRFPDEPRHPDHRVFTNLWNRLANGGPLVPGAVPPPRQGRRIYGVDPELEFLVMAQFADNPNLSTRICAVRLGLRIHENRLIHRILKANGLYPYKYQKVQALLYRDFQRRINFCTLMRERVLIQPNLFDLILWTDECTFTPNGMFNNKNYVEWRDENPFNIRQTKHQYRWSINIWAGIIGDQLVIIVFMLSF